jgi:hypothetical protein
MYTADYPVHKACNNGMLLVIKMLKAGNRVPLKSILRAMIITSQVPTARK